MKACNIYIISLDDDLQHRMIVSNTLAAINALVREAGEEYYPRMFFIDEPNEDALLGVINESKFGKPDLIVSIGLSVTLGLAELYKKREPINTIFVGIYDPVAYGLVESLERPGGYMSGVRCEVPDAHNFIRETFKPLVPAIKKIFMPYDLRLDQRNYSIKAVVTEIAKDFEALGCEVVLQEVDNKQAAIEGVRAYLQMSHAVAGFGLHFDTEQEVSYTCAMSERIFIGDRGDFSFDNGASVVAMPEDSTLLYGVIAQKIQNFWWHRKVLAGQPVVTLYEKPIHLLVNNFMLPYWAFNILLPLFNSPTKILFKNCWVRPPIQFPINKKK